MFNIGNAFKAAFNLFRSALDPIVKQLKTKEGRDKATHALASVINLGEHAVPIVKAALGIAGVGTPYADAVIDSAAGYGLKIEDALNEPDEFARMGKLIRIEGGGLRNYIATNVLPEAEHGIQIGEQVIHSIEDLHLVPNKVFDAAVHVAHVAVDVAGEVVKQSAISDQA